MAWFKRIDISPRLLQGVLAGQLVVGSFETIPKASPPIRR